MNLNWLQLEGRVEGFEHYVESLFGPGGLYEQKELKGLLQGLRSKRRTHLHGTSSDKLAAMDKQFNAASHFLDEPQVRFEKIVLKLYDKKCV